MKRRPGRPRKHGADRNVSGRIRYGKPDDEPRLPRNGPVLSREETWLRSKFSPQALEAARWYGQWIKHRNHWLGYDEWKLPGCDLTVSERLGRRAFTQLVNWPGRFAKRPSLSSDGTEQDDREAHEPPMSGRALTEQFAPKEPRSAAEAAAQDINDHDHLPIRPGRDIVAEHRAKGLVPRRMPDGPRFNGSLPRRPSKSPIGPEPAGADARCPQCTGKCTIMSEGNDPCEWRERIRTDLKAERRIFLGNIPGKLVGIRQKRMLVDHFALEGQFPAPFELVALEEVLMELHRFFRRSLSRSDWADDTRARRLNGEERRALYIEQASLQHYGRWEHVGRGIRPRQHEIILHVAKTEGLDLKHLGRIASASAVHAAGRDLLIADKIRQAIDIGTVPPGQDEAFYKKLAIAALEEARKFRERQAIDPEFRYALRRGGPSRHLTETINRAIALLDQKAMKRRAPG